MSILVGHSESRWTHPLCGSCWTELTGLPASSAVKLTEPADERCCRCSRTTDSGIYYRHDPADPSWVCPERKARKRAARAAGSC